MNYYAHHLGDYMRDTAHLSALEDGIYRRLLDRYYASEKALPDDIKECCRLARISTLAERRALQKVLAEFFQRESDGLLHQKKCDQEIQRYNSKQNKARDSANARWDAQRTQCERNANASKTHDERNAPNNQQPITNKEEPPKPPEGLDGEAWSRWEIYRRKTGKTIKPASREAAMRKLAALGEDQAAAVENSIANGYQGLIAPSPAAANGRHLTKYEQSMKALDAWEAPNDTRTNEASLAIAGPDVGRQVR